MEREEFDEWKKKINWVETIMQVFKCVSHAMQSNESKHKMHLFSPCRSVLSFLTELPFDKHLFFVFFCLSAKDKPSDKPSPENSL